MEICIYCKSQAREILHETDTGLHTWRCVECQRIFDTVDDLYGVKKSMIAFYDLADQALQMSAQYRQLEAERVELEDRCGNLKSYLSGSGWNEKRLQARHRITEIVSQQESILHKQAILWCGRQVEYALYTDTVLSGKTLPPREEAIVNLCVSAE